jgi:hypothetical protein
MEAAAGASQTLEVLWVDARAFAARLPTPLGGFGSLRDVSVVLGKPSFFFGATQDPPRREVLQCSVFFS